MIVARNHTGHRVGECHQKAKLTDEQVRDIRYLRQSNSKVWSYARLAARFNCGESTIKDIVTYRTRASA